MLHPSNALPAATAAVLVGAFALAGTGTATADPANTGSPSDVNTLAASLSKGYGLNNCTPQNITIGELASLTCAQSPDPSGPVQAKYILFNNADNLAGSFKASIKDDVLGACGDSGQSPTNWHQGSNSSNAGQVACGTYQNAAEIIWTTDSKNILSYIRGSNTDDAALYQWWRANG
ncbi:serine/threonine protein kinase [Mycobacterium sp. E342]|uniref:serine/threonine protein kinase n=1 Tax=Mycobacterium sp. E342 TaxID=1834147 RepID=UPI0008003F89|nr:serine/threonine protein kinase [Mycobacterium sp. E342]OBH28964.1 serine/threonine protein kinase [Mycobacterium sp. E342]